MTNLQPTTTSPVLPEHEDDPHTFHIFVLVKATRRWLDMKTEKRRAFLEDDMIPLLKQRPEIRMRWFEPEAFSSRASDIMLCETTDLSAGPGSATSCATACSGTTTSRWSISCRRSKPIIWPKTDAKAGPFSGWPCGPAPAQQMGNKSQVWDNFRLLPALPTID